MKIVLALLLTAGAAVAHTADMTGEWIEPTGSVVRIDHCGPQLCMWVVTISSKAPSTFDIYNPDPARRSRSLCGLQIGSGFSLHSPGDARDGTVYDPKSGKTYHGQIKLEGDRLYLRGYVGIPLFGETQTWTRPSSLVSPCKSDERR
jgi:uncharacterized protein (DUF2147 family)